MPEDEKNILLYFRLYIGMGEGGGGYDEGKGRKGGRRGREGILHVTM